MRQIAGYRIIPLAVALLRQADVLLNSLHFANQHAISLI
jgi:hypothetical protein